MRNSSPLRLVKTEDPLIQDTGPGDGRQTKPLSIKASLAVWAIMAALAWGVIALLLHFL